MTGPLGGLTSLRRSEFGGSRTTWLPPVHEFGHANRSETACVAFARHYDPQSIHTDSAWSATDRSTGCSPVASTRRLHACLRRPLHLPSGQPGLDEIRRPRPVRSGDRLRLLVTVAETRASRSRPTENSCTQQSRHVTRTNTSCSRSPL